MVLLVAVGVLGVSSRGKKAEMQVVACQPENLSGEFLKGEKVAWFEGEEIWPVIADGEEVGVGPSDLAGKQVLGTVNGEKWIEVDLSEQKLIAHEGDRVFLETPVSSGKWAPTPTGEFRIWIKLRYAKMEGGKKGTGTYYYLPNVPYVMYFENSEIPGWRGFGLHGTYWHNNFGNPMSHGCVNLPTEAAGRLYYWVSPVLPDGKRSVRAADGNLGTRIVIYE